MFAERYHPDTRKWLFKDFNKWFEDPGDSRAYFLLGDAGVGKSVLAAVLAHQKRNAGNLAAAYFCRHNDATRNNPRYLLGTIACQLCKCNEEYTSLVGGEVGIRNSLGNSALGVQELFTKLLQEPLAQCAPAYLRKLVIIDALDETEYESREDFLDLIMRRFLMLPQWLVFFITSRPEDCVQFRLKKYKSCIKICAGNRENVKFYQQHEQDIKLYLEKSVDFSRLPISVDDIAKKCDGLFLYAFYIVRALSNQLHSGVFSQLDDLFPEDIEDFFMQNFRRVFLKVGADLYKKLFGCVVVAPSPLPLSFISLILQRENPNLDEQEVIDALSTFLLFRTPDQSFTFLHNLIPAWLTNREKASRKLFIDRIKAGEYFRDVITTCLSEFLDEQSEVSFSIDTRVLDYVLRVGVRFLRGFSDKVSLETISRCLTSFKFIQARIKCRRNEIYLLINDFKREAENKTSRNSKKQVIQEIYAVVEKNVNVLSECPELLHSCLRMTSKAVQDAVIPYGVSTCWMEYSWARNAPCEIPFGISYFALSPDKKWLAGGTGQSIFLFDASTLERIQGPIKVVESGDDIHYVEFSSDSKLLCFGRLDKWFSLDEGCLKDLPQFAGKNRLFKWGSLALRGRYIVVKDDDVWNGCHTLSCLKKIFCLWARHELKQIKSVEIFCTLGKIKKAFDFFFFCIANPRFRIEEYEITRLRHELHDFLWEKKNDKQMELLQTFFSRKENAASLCARCSASMQELQVSSFSLVRQLITYLYSDIFWYQVWNLESGKSVLEEAFSSGTQPNPLFLVYHLAPCSEFIEIFYRTIDEVESLCDVAVANAMYCIYKSLSRGIAVRRYSDRHFFNLSKSVLLSPYFLTPPKMSLERETSTKASISLDQNWIAIWSYHHLKVLVCAKILKSENFDHENPRHVIKDVKAFAFTDDCSVFLYLSTDKVLCALSLQTGTTLLSVSGCTPLYLRPEGLVGYCFRTGDEERNIFVKDFPRGFIECVWRKKKIYFRWSEIAFSSTDTLKSIGFGPTLSFWKIANVDVPSVVYISNSRLMVGESPFREFEPFKNCVFSCSGELLATQESSRILLFKQERFVCTVFEEGDCNISCMIFSTNSALFLFCIEKNKNARKFFVWDVQERAVSASCDSFYLPSVECCCFSSDNAKVFICGQRSIQIWEHTGNSCRLLKMLEPSGICRESDKFTHCTVSSNDKLLACCFGDKILLYSEAEQASVLQIPHCHLGRVDFCQFLKGTRYLMSYGVDGVVLLRDLKDRQTVAHARITQGMGSIVRAAVSPEEDKVVCLTSDSRLNVIKLCGLKCDNLSEVPLVNTNASENANHLASHEQLKEGIVPTFKGSASHDNLDISTDDWFLVLSSDEDEADSDED